MNGDNYHDTPGERLSLLHYFVCVGIAVVAALMLWAALFPVKAVDPSRDGLARQRNTQILAGPVEAGRME